MGRVCGILVVVLMCMSCASGSGFTQYPACNEKVIGGRVLHDFGMVVARREEAGTGKVTLSFRSTYWGTVIELDEKQLKRLCPALRAQGGFDASRRAEHGAVDVPRP